jgi:glycosyltransferase 2 family protein
MALRLSRSFALSILKVLFTLCALGWIVAKVDLAAVALAIRSVPAGTAMLAFALLVIQAVLSAWRWCLVADVAPPRLRLGTAVRLFMISLFYNQALPSPVPGDAARVFGVVKAGAPLGAAIAAVLGDRVLTLIGLALLVFASQGLRSWIGNLSTIDAPAFALAALILAGGAFLLLVPVPAFIVRRFSWASSIERIALSLRQMANGRRLIGLMMLSLIIHGTGIAALYGLVRGLGLPMSLTDCFLSMPSVFLLSLFPLAIGGWGVREGAMELALANYGISSELAVTLSILYGLVQLVIGLIGGLLLLADK